MTVQNDRLLADTHNRELQLYGIDLAYCEKYRSKSVMLLPSEFGRESRSQPILR